MVGGNDERRRQNACGTSRGHLGAGVGCGSLIGHDGVEKVIGLGVRIDACSCSRRANTSARSSARAGGVGAVAMWKLCELPTGVEAISIRLSARSACRSRGRSGVEAKTMRT